MSALRMIVVAAAALAGCGELVGFGGEASPLATFRVRAAGSPPSDVAHLRLGIVWGAQWQPEPFCFLPAESAETAAVIAAGCSDLLRFVPARMQASVEAVPDIPTEIDLQSLPSGDLMVGDVTARVAYASVFVFDDRDESGTLEIRDAQHEDPENVLGAPPPAPGDVVLGASFASMTAPDQRIAFREGAFVTTGFYPRAGCPSPPKLFSILRAGGFSFADAIVATMRGELPQQDPSTCETTAVNDTVVSVPLDGAGASSQLACREDRDGTRYHEPPTEPIDLSELTWACAKLPSFGEIDPTDVAANQWQLVIANPPGDPCIGMFHFVLRGCDRDPTCTEPEWSWLERPQAWWPCPP